MIGQSGRVFDISRVICGFLSLILSVMMILLMGYHEVTTECYKDMIWTGDDIWFTRILNVGGFKVMLSLVIMMLVSIVGLTLFTKQKKYFRMSPITKGLLILSISLLTIVVHIIVLKKYFYMIDVLEPRAPHISRSNAEAQIYILKASIGGILFSVPALVYLIFHSIKPTRDMPPKSMNDNK